MRRLIASTLAVAVALTAVTPAFAQAYRYSEAYAPQRDEVTATVNYRVPLGANAHRPTYGLTLNASRGENTVYLDDGRSYSPEATLADLRFDGRSLDRAQLGAWDFAQPNLGWDDSKDPKDGKDGKDPKTVYWIVGVMVAIGIAVWVADDDDNHHHSTDTSD